MEAGHPCWTHASRQCPATEEAVVGGSNEDCSRRPLENLCGFCLRQDLTVLQAVPKLMIPLPQSPEYLGSHA